MDFCGAIPVFAVILGAIFVNALLVGGEIFGRFSG